MKASKDISDLAQAIATIVQQQGQQDFPSYLNDNDMRKSTLCGMTVYIKNGMVISLKARDIEVMHGPHSANDTEKNDSVIRIEDHLQQTSDWQFAQGSHLELERWYNRLTRFQTVFCYPPITDTGTA